LGVEGALFLDPAIVYVIESKAKIIGGVDKVDQPEITQISQRSVVVRD
jgi:hypothetical protein